ncbi:MAG: hypothetical protein GXO54_00700 [Chloroflexi bacterium]|nr:hypothetical protein [Chloroflexota bacterium]
MVQRISWPALTEQAIRAWLADDDVWRRGDAYRRAGRVRLPRRSAHGLRAVVYGQAVAPYRVWIRIDAQGIQRAQCTCPVGRDGRCKHVAAVLSLWLHQPGAFLPLPDWAHRLRDWPAERLRAFAVQVLTRCPEAEAWLLAHEGKDERWEETNE